MQSVTAALSFPASTARGFLVDPRLAASALAGLIHGSHALPLGDTGAHTGQLEATLTPDSRQPGTPRMLPEDLHLKQCCDFCLLNRHLQVNQAPVSSRKTLPPQPLPASTLQGCSCRGWLLSCSWQVPLPSL